MLKNDFAACLREFSAFGSYPEVSPSLEVILVSKLSIKLVDYQDALSFVCEILREGSYSDVKS